MIHENLSDALKYNDAMLIIGDRAYEEQKTMSSDITYYDLAEAWRAWTGLPFIFALWLVRSEIVDLRRSCIAEIHKAFLRSISLGLKNLDDICDQLSYKWSRKQIMEYFQINLAYDLHEDGIRGLTAFIHELYCHNLIPQKVSLRFFES